MSETKTVEGFRFFKPFVDNRNYPYGLERSGDYSIREAERLRKLGETFRRLEVGELQPESEVEAQFVKMIRGEKEATTDNEKLWLKYRARVEGKSRAGFSFTASYYYAKGSQTMSSDDDFSGDYADG